MEMSQNETSPLTHWKSDSIMQVVSPEMTDIKEVQNEDLI